MPDLRQLDEDRALRDAAKSMLTQDVDRLRGDMKEQSVAKRALVRAREGVEGLGGDAEEFIRENPARVGSFAALGIGLLLLYSFRDTIASLVETVLQTDDLEAEATERDMLETEDV